MKLALGTAAFGMNYGVTNQQGKIPAKKITKILNYCRDHDILTIDTASAYGDSEYQLGRSGHILQNFQIVTKILPKSSPEVIEDNFFKSLNNLNTTKVYCLLVHSADDLLSNNGDKIWSVFESLKNRKLVQKKKKKKKKK